MADLSWVREAGAARRASLDQEAKAGPAAARHLTEAMFDGLITPFWRRIGTDFKETVEAYNLAGRFFDLSFAADHDRIEIERRHAPVFGIDLRLDRTARTIELTVRDGPEAARSESLDVVFVDDELLLWHAGQTENGYQLAKRLLKPRL